MWFFTVLSHAEHQETHLLIIGGGKEAERKGSLPVHLYLGPICASSFPHVQEPRFPRIIHL